MKYFWSYEEFVRDGNFYTEDFIKQEIREMKINILECKYMCTDAYSIPEKPMMWEPCPDCGLRPLIWEFNNGRSTACGCGDSQYDHHSINAESVMSVVERCGGSAMEYETDELRKNWNEWTKTRKAVTHQSLRQQGKW